MSLETDVAALLRADPATRISFTVENVTVNRANIEAVAAVLDKADISVIVGPTDGMGAIYSSYKGRAWKEGERKVLGEIKLSAETLFKSPSGKAGIYHECVHAMMDVKGFKVTPNQDEIVGYLADAMYLRANKSQISVSGDGKALYDAAFGLVDTRKMLAKPGTVLKWTDCEALSAAVKKVYNV